MIVVVINGPMLILVISFLQTSARQWVFINLQQIATSTKMARWRMKEGDLISLTALLIVTSAYVWKSASAQDNACSPSPCGVNTNCDVSYL